MSELSSDQFRRARVLSDAGLNTSDAAALVAIWDSLPPWRRWIGMTKEERAALRETSPQLADELDRDAETLTNGRWLSV